MWDKLNHSWWMGKIISLDSRKKWFIYQWIVDDNARNIDTLLGIESLSLLLKKQKFTQFTDLFDYHFHAARSESAQNVLFEVLHASVNNLFADLSLSSSFDSIDNILLIYEKLIIFLADSKYSNWNNISDKITANTNSWLISLLEDILMSDYKIIPREKYGGLVDMFFDLRRKNRRISWYNLDSEQIWEKTREYFDNVFNAYIALDEYDKLTTFVLSNESFKRYLDIESIKHKSFSKLLDKLQSCKSKTEAEQLKFCIDSLTRYFASMNSKERTFMNIFQKQCDNVYDDLSGWWEKYSLNVVSLF